MHDYLQTGLDWLQEASPLPRSDLHAEMNVLNQLENMRQTKIPPIEYTLYTSLQPCMMCLDSLGSTVPSNYSAPIIATATKNYWINAI